MINYNLHRGDVVTFKLSRDVYGTEYDIILGISPDALDTVRPRAVVIEEGTRITGEVRSYSWKKMAKDNFGRGTGYGWVSVSTVPQPKIRTRDLDVRLDIDCEDVQVVSRTRQNRLSALPIRLSA